jgi:hypothetical protein
MTAHEGIVAWGLVHPLHVVTGHHAKPPNPERPTVITYSDKLMALSIPINFNFNHN